MATVLIIDDDARLSEMVASYLSARGLSVSTRSDAASGLRALEQAAFDAVVLDVMLPDQDGFDVLRALRARYDVPVLMLTARGDPSDRIVGLELGADDYLPKPVDPRELLARQRALLRRTRRAHGPDRLEFGPLTVDRAAREVRVDGNRCELTSHQFALLLALAERPGRVLSREQLFQIVRGDELEAFDRSIDVHVSRIRAAIEVDSRSPRWIQTVRGVGYVFTPPGPERPPR